MEIHICVGSSCFIEDSHEIIKYLEKQIGKHGLEKKIVLNACLCMNNCLNRINMSVDGNLIDEVNINNIQQIFDERMLAAIND